MSSAGKTHLREFQARLNERLRQATGSHASARLGLAIGERRWLVDLSEAGEITPVPSPISPVPLTRDWFVGMVNMRGTLFAVSDLGRFGGEAPTPVGKESRLVAFAARLNFNAALLVTRMLGLHNVANMTPVDALPTQPWQGRRLVDSDGRDWTELSLSALAGDERFLMATR